MAVELRAGIRRFQIMSKMWGVIARAEAARPDQEPLTDDEVFETLAGERAVRLSMAEILYAKGRTADADRDIQNADIIAELLPARQASLSEVRDFCFYYLLEHQITADDIGLGRTLSTLREHFSNFPAAAAVRIIRELLADPRPQKRQRPQTGAATPPTTESETPS